MEKKILTGRSLIFFIGIILIIISIAVWASGICVPSNTIDTKEFSHKYKSEEDLERAEPNTIRVRGKITSIFYREKGAYSTGDCTEVRLDSSWYYDYHIAGDVTDEYKTGDYVVVTNTDDRVRPYYSPIYGHDEFVWEIEQGYDNTWIAWACGILGVVFVIIFLMITFGGSIPLMSPEESDKAWERFRRGRELSEATSPIPRGLRPGCCIVGVAYYNPKSKELTILREWRDEKLMKNKLGKTLVKMYYTLSPMFVMFIAESEKMKAFTRLLVNPFVNFATSTMNYERVNAQY